jgi:hypothetical protein
MFTEVTEVFAVCITMTVMKATNTSETSVYFYRLHNGTSQKAAIFIYFISGLEMHNF